MDPQAHRDPFAHPAACSLQVSFDFESGYINYYLACVICIDTSQSFSAVAELVPICLSQPEDWRRVTARRQRHGRTWLIGFHVNDDSTPFAHLVGLIFSLTPNRSDSLPLHLQERDPSFCPLLLRPACAKDACTTSGESRHLNRLELAL